MSKGLSRALFYALAAALFLAAGLSQAAVVAPTSQISTDAAFLGGKYTITTGSVAHITATYTVSRGDTLTATAINGPAPTPVPSGYDWKLAPGLSWTPPQNPMQYTFATTTVGTHTFIPDARTARYPGWNHSSGASVSIRVLPICAHGNGPQGFCSSCVDGYLLDGGECELMCQNGAGKYGECVACSPGYVLTGGFCVALPAGSIDSFSAPARVRAGSTAYLAWATSYMLSCAVNQGGRAIPVPYMSIVSSGTQTPVTITERASFVLTCSDGVHPPQSRTVSVSLSPLYIEQ